MPRYIEVVHAASETAKKVLALRAGALRGTRRDVTVTTNGGRTASVNWSSDLSNIVLNMPSLPPDAVLNRAEADRLVAFIIHECCHVLHSDRDVWALAVKAGARVRDWTNALEDVRIEATEIAVGAFPAMGGLLASIANHLHYESVTQARRTIGATIGDAPYVAAILGRIENGYTIPAAAGLAAGISADVAQLMGVALPGVRRCRNTADVLRLAQQLVAMEQDMTAIARAVAEGAAARKAGKAREANPYMLTLRQAWEQGFDTAGDEGQGDEGQGDEGQGDEGQGDEGQGDEGQGDEGQGEDEGGGTEKGLSTDASLNDTVDRIADRMGIKDLDEHALTSAAHTLSIVQSTIVDPLKGLATDPGANAVAAGVLNARLPRNSVLHGQIGRLLVSAEVRRTTHHESAGRLDRRALVRMRAGATDVFSRRDDQPGIDTALMVMIDGSSSMRTPPLSALVAMPLCPTTAQVQALPTRMKIAQAAAWHIARAAEAAGAKVGVAAFHWPSAGDHGAKLTVVKDWDTPIADRAALLTDVEPLGGTPLSPAILAGAGMLAQVNATRHILMVLTDGECDLGPDAVTRACTLAGDAGVEVVGIGISCASVTAAFPPRYSVNVEDLAQLAQTGLGALVQMLEDANPRGAD